MLRVVFIGGIGTVPSSGLMRCILVVDAFITLGSVGVIIVRSGAVFAGIGTLGYLGVNVAGAGIFGDIGSCCGITVAKM